MLTIFAKTSSLNETNKQNHYKTRNHNMATPHITLSFQRHHLNPKIPSLAPSPLEREG